MLLRKIAVVSALALLSGVIVGYPVGHPESSLNSRRALTTDSAGTKFHDKDSTTAQHPGSLIKLMNAIIVREWIDDSELDDTITVVASDVVDPVTNSYMDLRAGDVVSFRDLLYGLIVPSGNDAGLALSRVIGGRILVSEGGVDTDADANRARFILEMNDRAKNYGMRSAVFMDSYGAELGNRMSAEDTAKLMWQYQRDSVLSEIGGTHTRSITVTGINARTYAIHHSIDAAGGVLLPEFVAGKTGTVIRVGFPEESSGGCAAVLWHTPSGQRRVTVVMGADPTPARYTDIRKLIDHELARLGEAG